jgi:hypothetical protein
MPFTCRSPAATLPLPCHPPPVPNAGTSPTCRLWMADVNSHIPCRSPAVALRGRFQKGIFVAWQGKGMACVNQTRPHSVNQMGKTQSKPLAKRRGSGTAWYVWTRLYWVSVNRLSEVLSSVSSLFTNCSFIHIFCNLHQLLSSYGANLLFI